VVVPGGAAPAFHPSARSSGCGLIATADKSLVSGRLFAVSGEVPLVDDPPGLRTAIPKMTNDGADNSG
jgi:hypothetical protein